MRQTFCHFFFNRPRFLTFGKLPTLECPSGRNHTLLYINTAVGLFESYWIASIFSAESPVYLIIVSMGKPSLFIERAIVFAFSTLPSARTSKRPSRCPSPPGTLDQQYAK